MAWRGRRVRGVRTMATKNLASCGIQVGRRRWVHCDCTCGSTTRLLFSAEADMAVIARDRVSGLRISVPPLLRLIERCETGELSVHYDREVDVLYVHLVPEVHSFDGVEIAPSIVAYLDAASQPVSFIIMHATK